MNQKDLSVILVSYNTAEMTLDALKSLYEGAQDIDMQVFVIDNASRDNSVEKIRRNYPQVHLIENHRNVGFGRANNQALPLLNSQFVLLLNTDAFIKEDTLQKSLQFMKMHPRCGILGVKLLGRDGELQPSCRYFPTIINIFLSRTGLNRIFSSIQMIDDMKWDHASARKCDWVPGCYYMIRNEVIGQVGLFDPLYFLYYEEVDHCKAVKNAGWDICYFPDTSVIHIGGESAKSQGEITSSGRQIKALQIESEILYFRKQNGALGVITHILLSNLADLIQLAKDIVKFRSPDKLLFNLRHSISFWKIFFQTRLGTVSTR